MHPIHIPLRADDVVVPLRVRAPPAPPPSAELNAPADLNEYDTPATTTMEHHHYWQGLLEQDAGEVQLTTLHQVLGPPAAVTTAAAAGENNSSTCTRPDTSCVYIHDHDQSAFSRCPH